MLYSSKIIFHDTSHTIMNRKSYRKSEDEESIDLDQRFMENKSGDGNKSSYEQKESKKKSRRALVKTKRYLLVFASICVICVLLWLYHAILKPLIRHFNNPTDAIFNEGVPTYYVDLHKYIDGEPKYNTYKNWNEYNSTWHSCLEISHVSYLLKPELTTQPKTDHYKKLLESLGFVLQQQEDGYQEQNINSPKDDIANYYLYTHPLPYSLNFMASEYYNYQDLIIAQLMHTTGQTMANIRVGNFTIPTMYANRESTIVVHDRNPVAIFPCMCTLLLHDDPESRDIKFKKLFKSDVLHMINMKVNNEQTTQYSAQITINMVHSMSKLFWMEIPSHLNVTFSTFNFGEKKLIKHNVMFYEPVNIVNLLNCASLTEVKLNKKWKIGSSKI